MTAHIIGMIAETHVHVGTGQSNGALDLPVAREGVSQYPFVPGSGVKGAMRVWAGEHMTKDEVDKLFGKGGGDNPETQAGSLLWSDARLALLPIRATLGAYRLATCPNLIARLRRDRSRAGVEVATASLPVVANNTCLSASGPDSIGLEEREFKREGSVDGLAAELAPLVSGVFEVADLESTLIVLSDDDFVWFARYGLPVMSRNKLGENKIVDRGMLWNEETMAPDTVLYLVLGERVSGTGAERVVGTMKESAAYVQMGGNETVGQGWFRLVPPASNGG